MRSMTGFGVGRTELGSGHLSLEVRALNHRYQDVRVRVPSEIADQSFFVEQLARSSLGRGRYDVAVRLEGDFSGKGGAPRISLDRLRTAYESVARLRDEIAPGSELSLSAFVGLPEVLESGTTDADAVRAALTTAFEKAKVRLAEMRAREGEALGKELQSRLENARALCDAIEAGSAELVEHGRKRLRERVEKLLADVEAQVEPGRLEVELALLADKSDITEELVRLRSHFDQLADFFASNDSVGRRLDFLLQEVGREVNTIGSKCQHASVSHVVVAMKAEVERMREQVQNVD